MCFLKATKVIRIVTKNIICQTTGSPNIPLTHAHALSPMRSQRSNSQKVQGGKVCTQHASLSPELLALQ